MSDTMTTEEIAQLVARDRDARTRACAAEIEEVLKKHRCRLEGVPEMARVSAGWITVAKVAVRPED